MAGRHFFARSLGAFGLPSLAIPPKPWGQWGQKARNQQPCGFAADMDVGTKWGHNGDRVGTLSYDEIQFFIVSMTFPRTRPFTGFAAHRNGFLCSLLELSAGGPSLGAIHLAVK